MRATGELALPGDGSRFDYASLDTDRGLLFIAHLGASEIIEVGIHAHRVVRTIPNLPQVHGVLVVPAQHRVYATATGANLVVSLDEDTGEVLTRTSTGEYPDASASAPITLVARCWSPVSCATVVLPSGFGVAPTTPFVQPVRGLVSQLHHLGGAEQNGVGVGVEDGTVGIAGELSHRAPGIAPFDQPQALVSEQFLDQRFDALDCPAATKQLNTKVTSAIRYALTGRRSPTST